MKNPTPKHLKNILLTILITSILLPGLANAVDYTVGVKTGDWIKYGQLTVNWTGTGTTPDYIIEQQKTDWAKLEVQTIIDTTIYFNATTHLNNGTQTSQTISIDLNSMSGMGSRFIIPANLNAGDPISPNPHSPTINQTLTRTYASTDRTVNLLNVTSTYQNQTTTVTIYYDQAKGMAVELYTKIADFHNPNATVETLMKATETNMWTPNLIETLTNNIIYIIAGTIITAAIIITAIALRKKKPPPPQQPPQPPQAAQTDENKPQG